MRWVKLTLPPRPRARWLLMTMRLSASSFAGTARTLVAVGTWSEASMFWAMRAAAPRHPLDVGIGGRRGRRLDRCRLGGRGRLGRLGLGLRLDGLGLGLGPGF